MLKGMKLSTRILAVGLLTTLCFAGLLAWVQSQLLLLMLEMVSDYFM